MGLIFYSVFSGLPILIQAYLGIAIQKRLPMVTSFTDFVQRVSLFLWTFMTWRVLVHSTHAAHLQYCKVTP